MIRVSKQIIKAFAHIRARDPDLMYVYGLARKKRIFYVGSTNDPLSRYFEHVRGNTKNTEQVIAEMLLLGEYPEMIILDVTMKDNRIPIEAKWINSLEGVINNAKYADVFDDYKSCPSKYPCLSDGTFHQEFKYGNEGGAVKPLEKPQETVLVFEKPFENKTFVDKDQFLDMEYCGIKYTIRGLNPQNSIASIEQKLEQAKKKGKLGRFSNTTFYT